MRSVLLSRPRMLHVRPRSCCTRSIHNPVTARAASARPQGAASPEQQADATSTSPASTSTSSSLSSSPWSPHLFLSAAALAAAAASLPLPCFAAAAASAEQGSSITGVTASLEAAVASAGPAGPVLFAAAYAVAVAALVPAAPLTLLAGALFGPVVGTAVVSAGATTGATLAFLLARGAAAPALEKVLAGRPAWDSARSALSAASASGAKLVFLLRLSPLIPFSLSNYALGALTDVGTGAFVAGTWAGALPGTAA